MHTGSEQPPGEESSEKPPPLGTDAPAASKEPPRGMDAPAAVSRPPLGVEAQIGERPTQDMSRRAGTLPGDTHEQRRESRCVHFGEIEEDEIPAGPETPPRVRRHAARSSDQRRGAEAGGAGEEEKQKPGTAIRMLD